MEKKDKNLLSEEHLRKIKYRYTYKINETPKYSPILGGGEEFDVIPMAEAGEEDMPPTPNQTKPANAPTDATAPAGAPAGAQPPLDINAPKDSAPAMPAPETGVVPDAGMPPADDMSAADPTIGGNPASAGMPDPSQDVNMIQNDIIKHNIEAMKSIHGELESLSSAIQGLNSKLASLNAEVEEVREPSNVEKLMTKKEVSYPYYFNLNDYWKNNWFNEKRESTEEKGMRELPDGTYIADFDDLPRMPKMDVQSSFNDFI